MHLKHLGVTISTLRNLLTPSWDRWDRCTLLNERLGMFYKAARSRAQDNGKVCLHHRSIRHLKVKRQSFLSEEKWKENERRGWERLYYLLSTTGKNLRSRQETYFKLRPRSFQILHMCPQICLEDFNISSQHLIGSYRASKLSHRNTIANDSHTFHLRQCS